jgi:PIN domain nuclease of toxin-antitoxin system
VITNVADRSRNCVPPPRGRVCSLALTWAASRSVTTSMRLFRTSRATRNEPVGGHSRVPLVHDGRPAIEPIGRRAIEESDGGWWLSAASVWELAIKSSLGRLTLPASVDEYVSEKVQQGLRVLSVDWTHAASVERLPWRHRDPFDRLIVAQAQSESLSIVTKDPAFARYGIRVVW